MTYPTRKAVLDTLIACGPLPSTEVAEFFPGTPSINVSKVLGELRRTTPKRVYVHAWTRDVANGKTYPRAVYAAGDKPDARRPKPEAKRVIAKRYRERQKLRCVPAGPSSVFDLARFL